MAQGNRKQVLILGTVDPAGPALLDARPDVSYRMVAQTDPKIPEYATGADAIIVRTLRITETMIDSAPRLAIVARHGVGYDNVDVAALTGRGIPLAVAGEANSPSVAEHALFLMLTVAKVGLAHDRATRTDDWGSRDHQGAIDLGGKTVLVVGFGRIGRRVAALCRAFGMTVAVHDPYVPAAAIEDAGCRAVAELAAGLGDADVLTLHTPLSDETRGMIGAEALRAIKSGAILVNTSRGPVVDEVALAGALAVGKLRGAGLDVFHDEPPAANNPLFGLDNVVLSPHIAGVTREASTRMSVACAENVLAAFDGTLDPARVINREVLVPE